MSNATMTTNNNTIEQPFSFEQTEQNGLITTTLTISNPTQETINTVNSFLASGETMDNLVIQPNPIVSLPDIDVWNSLYEYNQFTNTRIYKSWTLCIYHPLRKKYKCIITLDRIKKNDGYIVCETCRQYFSIQVKYSWVDLHNNCPHCRSEWKDYTVYINSKERRIVGNSTIIICKDNWKACKRQEYRDNQLNKRWKFKNKFYNMMRNKRR